MQKYTRMLCGTTLVLGIFGAFFRWVQLRRAVEADTGLFIVGSPWSILMTAFLVIGAVVLFFLVRSKKNERFPLAYPAVYAGGSRAIRIAAVFAGVLLAVGGVLTIVYAMHYAAASTVSLNGTVDYTPVFDLALGLFAVISGVAAAVFVVSPSKPKPVKGYGAAALLVLFLCFWLIAAYKYSADDPVLWNFSIRLLMIAATVLAFYYAAGFVYEKPHPLAALYFCQLSAFLAVVTLADVYPLGEQLMVFAFLLFTMLLSILQLQNAGVPAGEQPAQDASAASAPDQL